MRVAPLGVLWLLALGGPPQAWSSCPSQCSCSLHVLGDGTKARTVVCSDPDMTLPPASIPPDTSRLRLERTALRRLPGEAFRRLLALQPTRLSAVPPEAARFLENLTFLDLSSNQLMRLPQELLVTWEHLKPAPFLPGHHARLVLGLQDNPWVCDCRLYDLVRLLDGWVPNLAFIEVRLKCASPHSLAGVALGQLELRKCQSPELQPGATSVKSPSGSAVLLRCGASGVPGPEMRWKRADGSPLNGTERREVSRDGMSWALLDLPAVSYLDSGDYVCQAKNFLGAAETLISLTARGAQPLPTTSLRAPARRGPAALPTGPAVPRAEEGPALQLFQMDVPGPEPNGQAGPQEGRTVRSLKVVGDTYHSATLAWKVPQAANATALSVLYGVFGQRSLRRVNVRPGKTRITLDGLAPKTKYVACVCARGLLPRKEQCVIFSTDEVVDAGHTQQLINVVGVSVAAVIAVPLTLLVCCSALRRRCRRHRTRGSGAAHGHVSLERLGRSQDRLEVLTPHSLSEVDRLLSARSSMDSQAPGVSGARRIVQGRPINEYFC
ncbi:Leucine-rich repeat, immunoglobulin-like domain and transmembrane domain-containing protein 1 [Tupaia chinensis]|nr:Leucine-rich repeat, immunoglobulin-like domain and transmembrane domain-containing protein 1 [Tupaia chinensis]